ncbi:hypothetical protein ABIE78_002517 [Sinorhizobium fredii]
MLFVEKGLSALVLGEVQIFDCAVGEFERAVPCAAAEEAHDTVDPAELFEVQPRQVD